MITDVIEMKSIHEDDQAAERKHSTELEVIEEKERESVVNTEAGMASKIEMSRGNDLEERINAVLGTGPNALDDNAHSLHKDADANLSQQNTELLKQAKMMTSTIAKLKSRVQQLSKALEQSLEASADAGLKVEILQRKRKNDGARIGELEHQLLGKKEEFLLLREKHDQMLARVDELQQSTASSGFIRVNNGVSRLLVNASVQASDLEAAAAALD